MKYEQNTTQPNFGEKRQKKIKKQEYVGCAQLIFFHLEQRRWGLRVGRAECLQPETKGPWQETLISSQRWSGAVTRTRHEMRPLSGRRGNRPQHSQKPFRHRRSLSSVPEATLRGETTHARWRPLHPGAVAAVTGSFFRIRVDTREKFQNGRERHSVL